MIVLISLFLQVQGETAHLSITNNRIQQSVYICGRLEKGSLQLRGCRTRGYAYEGMCPRVWIHTLENK